MCLAAPPVGVDDIYPQAPTGPTVVPAGPGILKNDTVPCGSLVEIEVVSLPIYGTIKRISEDGAFTYEPTGTPTNDHFRYRISCGELSSVATVYLPAPPGEGVFSSLQGVGWPVLLLVATTLLPPASLPQPQASTTISVRLWGPAMALTPRVQLC